MRYDVTIAKLNLKWNNPSTSFLISNLTIHCRVEELSINYNHFIGEDPALYDMLSHPSSRLVRLDMMFTSLSTTSTIILFTALAKGNKLQVLNINNNPITDEACDVIATTMRKNTSLVELRMSCNEEISREAAQNILQALQHNNTLQVLELPWHIMGSIVSLEEEVNKKRQSRGCQTELNINFSGCNTGTPS